MADRAVNERKAALRLLAGTASAAALAAFLHALIPNAAPLPSFVNQPLEAGAALVWPKSWLEADEASFDPNELIGKVAIVQVGTAWSAPARRDRERLLALAVQLDPERFAVVFALTERPDTLREVQPPMAERAPYFAAQGRLPLELVTGTIPATFILDRKGRIRGRHLGEASWTTPEVSAWLHALDRE